MAYEIEWAESAIAGLLEAVEYIARDSPSYAAALAVRAERTAASLSEFPHRGRRVAEYKDPNVRELVISNHRLIYRVGANLITVIAFVHTARDLTRLVEESAQ
ncbi:MAG TPA: type II toxin-antitoxin system RelE/ParE family toxin [Thermoanaerobaculia bacterium]|nr:type II toxin-antitoxin system RelE/ParE family toxin [Thermoanaerobaculia bacterium]